MAFNNSAKCFPPSWSPTFGFTAAKSFEIDSPADREGPRFLLVSSALLFRGAGHGHEFLQAANAARRQTFWLLVSVGLSVLAIVALVYVLCDRLLSSCRWTALSIIVLSSQPAAGALATVTLVVAAAPSSSPPS